MMDRSGTFFRYICDNGTYIARYDELLNGKNESIDVSKVDVSMNGIELQDREFFAAIRERARTQCQRGAMPARHADIGSIGKAADRGSRLEACPNPREPRRLTAASRRAARHSSRRDWRAPRVEPLK